MCQCAHLQPGLGRPGQAQPVGQDGGRDSGPVVTAPAHQHHPQAGDTSLRAERHVCGAGAHLRSPNRAVSVRLHVCSRLSMHRNYLSHELNDHQLKRFVCINGRDSMTVFKEVYVPSYIRRRGSCITLFSINYRYIVSIRAHRSGLVGISRRDVRLRVLHIRAVDVNVQRHDGRFWNKKNRL